MKKIILCIASFALITISNQSIAQSTVKKEVKKEVTYEEHKGEKHLTITTTKNGKTTSETFKGAKAEAKLKELEAEKKQSNSTTSSNKDKKKNVTIESEVIIKKEK